MPTNRMLVLLGGAILVIGSRLPWMSVPVLYGVQGSGYEAIEIGWEDNGYVTGGMGLILAIIALLWRGNPGKRYTIPGAVLAGLAAFVVLGCFQSILEIAPAAGFFAAADVGLYVTLSGALLALTGALYPTPRRQAEPGAAHTARL